MGLSTFTFDGTLSSAYGVIIDRSGIYAAAERDYSTYEVPGRNGELTFDNGRWRNVMLTYSCMIGRGFPVNMPGFFAWLMSKVGYKRLEDSLQTDYYRMARVASAPEPDTFAHYIGGRFDVEFDCMPQKWLKSGEDEIAYTSSSKTVNNPTLYDAAPLIRITTTSSGSITIGGKTISLTARPSGSEDMIIDYETGDAYSATSHTNFNQYVSFGSGVTEFPKLKPGNNSTSIGTNLRNNFYLTPRWWTL